MSSRDEVARELRAELPFVVPGDVVYLERRGSAYHWRVVEPGTVWPKGDALPDAWMFHSGPWPSTVDAAAFVDDLIAETESMAGADRCRWPLDDPWPHRH